MVVVEVPKRALVAHGRAPAKPVLDVVGGATHEDVLHHGARLGHGRRRPGVLVVVPALVLGAAQLERFALILCLISGLLPRPPTWISAGTQQLEVWAYFFFQIFGLLFRPPTRIPAGAQQLEGFKNNFVQISGLMS